MVEPIQGLPSNLLNSLTSVFGANAVQSFVSYIEQGVPVSLAYSMAFGNDVRHDGKADAQAIAQAFDDMPEDVRQRIASDVDTLPPPVREALDQRNIAQAQPRSDGPDPQGMPPAQGRAGAEGVGPGRDGAAFANQFAAARSADAPGNAGPAYAAREAALQAPAFANQQVGPAQQADRTLDALVVPQQNARAGEAPGRAPDPGQAVVMADRTNAAQQQMQAQTLPPAQGRADALAAQVMPALAGATMLASPQVNPLPGQVTAPAPPGTDIAAAQAREAQIAPAGHTVSGFLRRDLRRGSVQPPRERTPGALLAVLAGRRRRRNDDEEGTSSFQWLFWILTIVAYGALALAVVAMIPSGGALTDGYGRPSFGAWALVVGAVAAVASWFIGRTLAKRA